MLQLSKLLLHVPPQNPSPEHHPGIQLRSPPSQQVALTLVSHLNSPHSYNWFCSLLEDAKPCSTTKAHLICLLPTFCLSGKAKSLLLVCIGRKGKDKLEAHIATLGHHELGLLQSRFQS